MIIIAFAGQARCGKTTMAHSFARTAMEQGFRPYLRSFAGPLKTEAAQAGLDKDTNPEAYRKFCQDRGKTMREADPNYWVNLFEKDLEAVARKDAAYLEESILTNKPYHEAVVLIDDLRYENEYELIARLHGHVILVIRNTLPDKDAEWRNHESEEFGNYWSTAPTVDQEGMFSTLIYNDTEGEEEASLDIMSYQIVRLLCSDVFDPDLIITGSLEELPSEMTELMDLLRRLRKLYEDVTDEDSPD